MFPKLSAELLGTLALTLIGPTGIPVRTTSVNKARSTGPALVAGGVYRGLFNDALEPDIAGR